VSTEEAALHLGMTAEQLLDRRKATLACTSVTPAWVDDGLKRRPNLRWRLDRLDAWYEGVCRWLVYQRTQGTPLTRRPHGAPPPAPAPRVPVRQVEPPDTDAAEGGELPELEDDTPRVRPRRRNARDTKAFLLK
jgi:hypothetical protein